MLVDPGPGSCIDTLPVVAQGAGDPGRVTSNRSSSRISTWITPAQRDCLSRRTRRSRSSSTKRVRRTSSIRRSWSTARTSCGVSRASRGSGERYPGASVEPPRAGEHDRILAGGRLFDVAIHARPRVASRELLRRGQWHRLGRRHGGTAFTSKVFTLPPTPPPDIDLEAWRESIAKIRAWKPETVFITHFGPYGGVAEHLDHFETSLRDVAEIAKRAIDSDASDEAKYARFKADVEAYVRRARRDGRRDRAARARRPA